MFSEAMSSICCCWRPPFAGQRLGDHRVPLRDAGSEELRGGRRAARAFVYHGRQSNENGRVVKDKASRAGAGDGVWMPRTEAPQAAASSLYHAFVGRAPGCWAVHRLDDEFAGAMTTIVGGPGGRPALAVCARVRDSGEWVVVDGVLGVENVAGEP